jgi:flagellin
MDQIFQFIPSSTSDVLKTQYNVMTKASRESLLGQPPDAGILDQGLEYLTDANTLIGAQINRMDIARANIVTQNENITATESKIRDADMAKEMTGYTKASILSQSAQSMLAIANQNSSGVLKLLQ